MRAWDRLMQWDRRVSRKLGLRFDDPEKTPEENIRLAQRRRRNWRRPPIVVEEADLLTGDEARALLRTGPVGINFMVARGILQHCFVDDGREGVTRSSVEQELDWRRTATRRMRFRRRLGAVLPWV